MSRSRRDSDYGSYSRGNSRYSDSYGRRDRDRDRDRDRERERDRSRDRDSRRRGPRYSRGDKVLAKVQGWKKYYPGKISRVHSVSLGIIATDDGMLKVQHLFSTIDDEECRCALL